MTTLRHKLLAGGLALAALLSATKDASADVQACLAASEKGQRARAAGRLREAREHFLVCGGDRCPALVRHDCAQWNSDLAQTLPTVVFGARDERGLDMFDVSVSMDGETLVRKLDGKSVTVDPGKHTFRFTAPGRDPITQVVLVKEGERARAIDVTFDDGGESLAPTSISTSSRPDEDAASSVGGRSPLPWVVVGLGAAGIAAGIVVAVTAPDRPENCDERTKRCTAVEGQSRAEFEKSQEQAGRADSQPILGYAIAGGGVALVAGGLLWHLLTPKGSVETTARISVVPWTTGKSSGLALGARF